MSTNLACFCCGVIAVALWLRGTVTGVSLPLLGFTARRLAGFRGRMIHRDAAPLHFWLAHGVYGALAWALLLLPVLAWAGLGR